MRVAAISAVLMLATLAGCGGSSSYQQDAQSAVNNMAAAIRAYDSVRAGDVAATGAACRTALDSLSSDSSLANETPSDRYRQVGVALTHAYAAARAGFGDCAAGATASDYALMAKAVGEITNANTWITQAKSLDH